MPKFETQKLITSLKAQLVQINKDFEQMIAQYDESTWQYKPSAKQWSAIECIQHLYLSNKYYLPRLEAALEKAHKNNVQPSHLFKSGFFGNQMFNSLSPVNGEIKKKMPTFKSIDPNVKYAQAQLNVAKVISSFKKQQLQFEKLLNLAEVVGLEKGKVPSLLGPVLMFKPGDVFRFLLAHEERHFIQAKNAIPQLAS